MKASNNLLFNSATLPFMEEKSINSVFAENLAALMEKKGIKQTALAAKSNLAQKTISNYLNPNQRAPSATGKIPSAKLTELEMIATALGTEPWKLLRPLNPNQRTAYEQIEGAFLALQPKATPPKSRPELEVTTPPLKVANGKHG